jgi:hypothetical protein
MKHARTLVILLTCAAFAALAVALRRGAAPTARVQVSPASEMPEASGSAEAPGVPPRGTAPPGASSAPRIPAVPGAFQAPCAGCTLDDAKVKAAAARQVDEPPAGYDAIAATPDEREALDAERTAHVAKVRDLSRRKRAGEITEEEWLRQGRALHRQHVERLGALLGEERATILREVEAEHFERFAADMQSATQANP